MITDGNNSFAVFTYQCGLLDWSRGTIIGYNAAGDFFENHGLSSGSAEAIACINLPGSNYSNVQMAARWLERHLPLPAKL